MSTTTKIAYDIYDRGQMSQLGDKTSSVRLAAAVEYLSREIVWERDMQLSASKEAKRFAMYLSKPRTEKQVISYIERYVKPLSRIQEQE